MNLQASLLVHQLDFLPRWEVSREGDIPEYYLKPDYSRIPTLNIKNVVQFLNSHQALSNQGEGVYFIPCFYTIPRRIIIFSLKRIEFIPIIIVVRFVILLPKILPMRRGEGVCPVIYPSEMVRY